MFSLRRKAVQNAGRMPSALKKRGTPYSTAHHGKEGGTSTEHGHHHAGPKEEPLGAAFYVVLIALPLSIGLYTISRPSKDGTPPSLTNIINSFNYYREHWAARNTAHADMMEQAAFDKHLFQNSKGSTHVELKFPEIFNTGSPFNVVAGQGPRNMDELVKHYEQQNVKEDERKAKAMAARKAAEKES